jgi:hypothetical protein
MDKLREFYFGGSREEVKAALMAHLDRIALSEIYVGGETAGFRQAKGAVDSFFKAIADEFEEKAKPQSKGPRR